VRATEDGGAHVKTEAIRALRRRISDEVYRRLRDDEAAWTARPSRYR
jgi:hypothetical protein